MYEGSYYVPLKELENGLVVPWKFAFTKSAAIGQIMKEKITHTQEL